MFKIIHKFYTYLLSVYCVLGSRGDMPVKKAKGLNSHGTWRSIGRRSIVILDSEMCHEKNKAAFTVQENCFRWGDQRSLSKLSKWHLNRPKYWERCSQTVIIRSLLGKLKRCWYVILHDFSWKHSCGNCLVKPLESIRHPPPILLNVPNISHSSLPAYPQATETVICWILSSAGTPTDFCMDDLVSFPGNLTYVVHFSRRICQTFCNPVLLRDLIMLCGSIKE